jgi:uncharacterized protein (TIGR02145 family)
MKNILFFLIPLFISAESIGQSQEYQDRALVTVNVKVLLEGAYTAGVPFFYMHNLLQQGNHIPYQQPFAPSIPYFGNETPVWYYSGNEIIQTMPENVVDWVLVELRDAPSADQAWANTAVARQAALLLRNGQIVNTQGGLPVFNVIFSNNLYVVIYHRNHLSVMSSGPINLSSGTYSWNFTSGPQQAYLSGQKHLGAGLYAMAGGDGDANGQIQNQDKNDVWDILSGLTGHLPADFDLNGQVQIQDKNNIWAQNTGLSSVVPGILAVDGLPCPDIPFFIDPRDGNFYRTVLIGSQCWLKDNLRYLPAVNPPWDVSISNPKYYVYDYSGNNVQEAKLVDNYNNYGVLYNWAAANSACPTGWHLPGESELSAIGSYLEGAYPDIPESIAGNALKSCRQVNSPLQGSCNTNHHPRWNAHSTHYGFDLIGFSALPAGYATFTPPTNFRNKGEFAYFWTSTQFMIENAFYGRLSHNTGTAFGFYTEKESGFSVRCIKDQ